MMVMSTIDLTIVQVQVDFITQRRAMEEVAITTMTAIVGEGAETITMTIIPWKKDIVIDHLTTTMSHRMDTIANIIIAVVDTRNIIESSIE